MSRSTLVTISDPLLEPYFITKDDHCFTVHERIQPKSSHFRTKGEGKEYAKPQGYYPDMKQALIKISKELVVTDTSLELDLDKIIKLILKTEKNIKEFIYANN